ncbi:MAG: phosphatase PAP2 family protein [Methylotenera sp.]
MIFKLIEELVELALIVTSLYFVIGTYLRYNQPEWVEPKEKHRLTILFVLILIVTIVKVSEDVLNGESGHIDRIILLFIHGLVPSALVSIFEAVTLTGSSRLLFPLATVVTVALLCAKRRAEALLVSASVLSGAIVIYFVKMMTIRTRPSLWDTEWYWGSSFPSGHTLAVAAFSTAIVLCVGKIRPKSRNLALAIAILWVSFVALSRMVLGVHWPTDVLVAACIGAFLPLAIRAAIESHVS